MDLVFQSLVYVRILNWVEYAAPGSSMQHSTIGQVVRPQGIVWLSLDCSEDYLKIRIAQQHLSVSFCSAAVLADRTYLLPLRAGWSLAGAPTA
jgi:hypothetical protein